jgi:hypothetical protein
MSFTEDEEDDDEDDEAEEEDEEEVDGGEPGEGLDDDDDDDDDGCPGCGPYKSPNSIAFALAALACRSTYACLVHNKIHEDDG